jgi:hypothetical protein
MLPQKKLSLKKIGQLADQIILSDIVAKNVTKLKMILISYQNSILLKIISVMEMIY